MVLIHQLALACRLCWYVKLYNDESLTQVLLFRFVNTETGVWSKGGKGAAIH